MDLLTAYQNELQKRHGASSSTPRTYTWAAKTFLDYFTERRITLSSFSLTVFRDFAVWLSTSTNAHGEPFAPSTLNTILHGVRSFVEWAAPKEHCQNLTAAEWALVRTSKEPKAAAVALTPSQLEVYFQALQQEPEPYRTVFALLPQTGQHLQELCTAPLAGAQRVNGTPAIHVRRKSDTLPLDLVGRYSRAECVKALWRVPLSKPAQITIRTYLTGWRADPGLDPSPWLFPSDTDITKFLPSDTARKMFSRFRKRAGFESWLTTHVAGRNTLATMLFAEGQTAESVSAVIGHHSPKTTIEAYRP